MYTVLSRPIRNVKLLFWFNFLNDFRPYSAVAVIYFAQVTGSYALALSVYSVSHVAAALFEVPTGVLSDIVGRRKTTIFGALASTFALVFYAIGEFFTVLAIGAVLDGLAQSFFSGNNDALLHDSLKENAREDEYAEWSGKTRSMFQLALGASAFFGGFIADWSLSYVMWVSVVPQLVSIIVAFLFLEPTIHTDNEESNIFSHLGEAVQRFRENYRLRFLSISSALSYGIGETSHQFVPAFYATLWPIWAVGLARTLTHAAGTVSFWFAGSVVRKFGAFKVLIADHIYCRILGITASAFPSIASPILISLGSFSFGIGAVAGGTLMQNNFSDQQRATMGSLNSLLGSIFFAIFAFLLGAFADKYNPAAAILLCELISLPNLYLVWRAYAHR